MVYYRSVHLLDPICGPPLTSSITYTVQGEGGNYTVNSLLGLCSCPAGITGAACKHQFAVRKIVGFHFVQHMPICDQNERMRFYKISTGHEDVPDGWFDPLMPEHAPSSSSIDDSTASRTGHGLPYASYQLQDCELPITTESDHTSPTDVRNAVIEQYDMFTKALRQEALHHPGELFQPLSKFMEQTTKLVSAGPTVLANGLYAMRSALTCRARHKYIGVQPTEHRASAPLLWQLSKIVNNVSIFDRQTTGFEPLHRPLVFLVFFP